MNDHPWIDPASGRLRVCVLELIHQAVGGDPVTEVMILRFIADQHGAKDLFHLPPKVAVALLDRPVAFLRAAKKHCQPELNF